MNIYTVIRSACITLALVILSGAVWARDTEVNNGHEVAAKQAILQINTAKVTRPLAAFLQQLTAVADADEIRPLNQVLGIYVIHSRSNGVAALLNVLKNNPAVNFVEPDYIVKPVVTPNDPDFPQQPDMYNSGSPGVDIGATFAWAVSTGSTTNVIGIVDTGIDYTHPDLSANMWSAPAAFTVTLSWGQLTCPAGSHGYNSIARSCNPADDYYHGTHVAGTAGAVGNNGIGVAGVNWTTRMMALKFMDSTGNGSVSDAIDAIEFGLQAKTIFGSAANLRVLSNSWAGSGFSQALLNEINKANTADVLFVAAAGNNSTSDDTNPIYPASYSAPNMITVAATTSSDGLASFSNYGATTVQLGAPGVNILSTLPANSYGYLSGTSMATPHVSGAAMLVLSACTLNTAGVRNAILANVDKIASLQGITTTGGRLNVNKAIRSCAAAQPIGTASFVKTDTTTLGSWKGVYGTQGYNVINDSAINPSYVAPSVAGNVSYIWASSTGDTRALQKGSSSTDRIAACWYTDATMSVNLNFTDSNSHQVALYLLDWDHSGGGRTQRVDISDASGTLLDSRAVSGFGNGQYLVWNLSGSVIVRITNTNGASNAVVSGVFFDAGGTAAHSGTASFLKTDTTTSGSWKSTYGVEGYSVINDSAVAPSYVTVAPSGNYPYTWAPSTSDTRALQKGASSSTDRIAACWYTASSFSIDLSFNDSNSHQVALYLLDWDNTAGGRTERVDITDTTGNVLDTRSASGFLNGQYLVWNLSGHVIVRITNTNPAGNAVVSGLFFGGGSSVVTYSGTASFLKTDSTTTGSWKGVYGADGYNVINDSAVTPAYVAVMPLGNVSYIWAPSTADTRALQKGASSTDRIAACWYSSSSFSIDLNFTDANTHQVALYLLDWDNTAGGRTQRVDITDANGNVLDTRLGSGFVGGQYLVWNLSGHVIARITNTNAAANAVISGLFFR